MSGILSMLSGGTYSSAPANTVAPVVSGTATVGQTLSSTTGTWTGAPTPTFTYQWQRAGSNIGSATSSTYTLVNADAGSTIRCVVTATNVVAAVSANSNATSAVAAIAPGAPTIGTATITSPTTCTVSFTAPASNGGATITSYTAYPSAGSSSGSLSQAGSGTINVTGLTIGQAVTFTVKATNSAGQSAASSASNSITPTLNVGDAFGGGYYIGTVSGYYQIIAPVSGGQQLVSGSNGLKWGPGGYGSTGITSQTNGSTNSAALAALGSAWQAATFCEGLSIGGYTDWYLPARNELIAWYPAFASGAQKCATSGEGTAYWSSTEDYADAAIIFDFASPSRLNDSASATYTSVSTRAMRKQAV
jgi:hypothetical protein